MKLGVAADEVLVGSTGVIGQPLPMREVAAGVPAIEMRPDGGGEFARAIMTTDTRPKTMAVTLPRRRTPIYHRSGRQGRRA